MFGRASLQGPIDAIIRQLSDLEGAAAKADAALAKTAEVTKSKYTAAQLEAAEETQKFIKRTREQAETMNLSGAALAEYVAKQHLATTGNKELSEEVYKVVLAEENAKKTKEALTKATQAKTKADREAKEEEERTTQERKDAELKVKALASQFATLREKEELVNKTRLQQMQDETQTLREEGQIMQASLAPRAQLRDLELQIAKARIDRATATELAAAAEEHLDQEVLDAIKLKGEEAKKNLETAASYDAMAQSIDEAALSTADLKSVTQGILSGTQDIGDIFEDLGQTAGVRMVEGIMFGKGQNEKQILWQFQSALGRRRGGSLWGARIESWHDAHEQHSILPLLGWCEPGFIVWYLV